MIAPAPAAKKRKTGPTSNDKVEQAVSKKDVEEDDQEDDEEEDEEANEDDDEDAEADDDEVDAAEATTKSGGPITTAKKNVGGTVPEEASLYEVDDDDS